MRLQRTQEPSAGDDERVLNEHREVCGFLLHMLLRARSKGAEGPLVWIDLGCGEGRILSAVEGGIGEELRANLRYLGLDMSEAAAGTADARLRDLGLDAESCCEHGDLLRVGGRFGETRAHFLTLTNVLHEVPPYDLPAALLNCIALLRPDGYLLAYDVERLADRDAWGEPDRVTWRRQNLAALVGTMLAVREEEARPLISWWRHTSTTGWTLIVPGEAAKSIPAGARRAALLKKSKVAVSAELRNMLEDAEGEIAEMVQAVEALPDMDRPDQDALGGALRDSLPHLLRERVALRRALGLGPEPGLSFG